MNAHDIADAALVALPAKLAEQRARDLESQHDALAKKIEDYGAEEGDVERRQDLAAQAFQARLFADEGDHGPHRY